MLACLIAIGVTPAQVPTLSQEVLLDDLQQRAVRFFWEQSEPSTGFTRDRATNVRHRDGYTVASTAATGFALTAYAIGVERKWLPKEAARERTKLTLRSLLTKWGHERGWLYHFADWKTGARMWNSEASSIDTSILLAGMLAAERYWKDPEITRDTNAFVKRMDFKWMMTDGGQKPAETIFSMGWKPESKFIEARWSGYSEEKMLFIQAYGADPSLPTDGWDRTNRQHETYKGIEFLHGGPLFIHQMSESFYDFSDMRDRRGYNYFVATRNATLANRQYCIDNPKKFGGYGPNVWGLSACDTPEGYKALGAPGWIDDNGTITPTAPLASLRYTPKESMDFAQNMRKNHPAAYGRYGFPNGYNPGEDWIDPDVIGIDLGMMLCGVENARTGAVHKWSMQHPIVKLGYQRAGLKKVPGSNKGPLKS
ncbi:MAG: glucoamylase family protein [Fimbriimonas sp.]